MADIPKSLKDFVKEIANEKDYVDGHIELQAISSEGANYTSNLFLASVSAPAKEDLKLFAKVAKTSKDQKDSHDMFSLLFETERFFYVDLLPTFEKLYNKHGVPDEDRFNVSKYYGYKSTEMETILILEDLGAKGYESFDRMKAFDWEYASKAVEELAKFHALGLSYKEENPEEFCRISQKELGVDLFSDDKMLNSFLAQGTKTGAALKEEYRGRIQKYLEGNNFLDAIEKLFKPSAEGFLIHGDYRSSNLMHRRRDGRMEVVPLDYQGLHLGILAADLMFFLWSGSDATFRKNYYQKLLEHYYTELSRALQHLHVDIKKVYPRNVFEQELESTKSVGLFIGLAVMSVLTVDPENAPKLDETLDLNITPNQIALDRINEIVDDYITWGII